MCLAQGPQRSDAGETRTHGPSVSSQALYHWATALPIVWSGYILLTSIIAYEYRVTVLKFQTLLGSRSHKMLLSTLYIMQTMHMQS